MRNRPVSGHALVPIFVVGALIGTWSGSASAGPSLVQISAQRRVVADVAATGTDAQGQPVPASDADETQSQAFGAFNGVADASVDVPFSVGGEDPTTGFLRYQSLVSQDSVISGGSVTGSGVFRIPGFARGDPFLATGGSVTSDLEYRFRLLTPHRFEVESAVSGASGENTKASIVLTRGDGTEIFNTPTGSITATGGFNMGDLPALEPGEYLLDFTVSDSLFTMAVGQGTYQLSFNATNIIPLPPAFAAGLSVMIGAAGWRAIGRRRRRAARPALAA